MPYTVKEIFYTLQGEGQQAGRAAVFLRFTGCNLWSGIENDRMAAACNFCDTDFVGSNADGGKFADAKSLAEAVLACWPSTETPHRLVVCTGGEPLLQLDTPLIAELKLRDFEIAVESNGTLPAPDGIDWLCVSPKGRVELKQLRANELKLVFPQPDAPPERFANYAADAFLLQPMDGPARDENTRAAIAYCLEHPQWRLCLQSHKLLGLR